jgi:hypothetical protein
MSNQKNRVKQLEKDNKPAQMTWKEFTQSEDTFERLNHVLLNPSLVAPETYERIVEIVDIAKARKIEHEQTTQPLNSN